MAVQFKSILAYLSKYRIAKAYVQEQWEVGGVMEAALPPVLVEGHLGSFTASLAQQLQGGPEHQPFPGFGRAAVLKAGTSVWSCLGAGTSIDALNSLFM